jgi:hypothetical protein
MPALTLVLRREVEPSPSPVARVTRLRVPVWTALLAVLVAGGAGFVWGRHKPAHHYVSYFGYPMVLDTTTGKACYAVKPKSPDAASLQDSAFAPDGADRPDTYVPNGPSVPLCGQE